MDNFFEEYLEWIIDKYNDGENINDILTSGYTANTGTYYCPECQYVLASVQTYLIYAGVLNLTDPEVPYDYGCCINVMASLDRYLQWAESFGYTQSQAVPAIGYSEQTNREFPFCCNTNKFCLESNFSPQNMDFILGVGVVEQSSSSEIYDTNLCYLFDRLNQEEYSESQVFEIFSSILNYGIIILCCNGVISAIPQEKYLVSYEGCDVCIFTWNTPTYEGQSQIDACSSPSIGGFKLYSGNINLQIGDIIYYDGTLTVPFNGNDNWFNLDALCVAVDSIVVQINNNGEIIDIGCP